MTDDEAKKFLEWLQPVCSRPAMFIGRANIDQFVSFLTGYAYGFDQGSRRYYGHIGGWSTIGKFWTWLQLKFVVSHPAWGPSRILHHHFGHDDLTAIRAIPVLLEEYLRSSSEEDTYELLKAAIEEKYGPSEIGSFGSPSCEICK